MRAELLAHESEVHLEQHTINDFLRGLHAVRESDAIAFSVGDLDARTGRIVGTAAHFDVPNANGWAIARGALDRWMSSFRGDGRKLPRLSAAASITTRVGFKRSLRDQGFSRSAASKLTARGWAAMPNANADDHSNNDALLARIAAATQ